MQHKVLKRSSPIKSGGSEAEVASDGAERQDSGDSVKIQMEAAREQHRRRLAKKGKLKKSYWKNTPYHSKKRMS